MLEVADIIRLHGPAYLQQHQQTLSSVQKRALRDIAACRTPFFGGHVYQCDHCQQKVFSYHSCRNRSCPKCHHAQTERWLQQQQARLLPCSYFLLTFTLPDELRPLARSHPKKVYGLLMKAAAAALQKLVRDPRYLGGRIGALAVLHTWTRAMLFHPHVHMLVTAGGLAADGGPWISAKNPHFLVPVRALSVLFRAKLCAALNKARLLQQLPPSVWKKKWIVHSQHAGRGDKVLAYLARYVFPIAITNNRLESIAHGHVRFRYRDNRDQQLRHVTLSAVDFIDRFVKHVLPRGTTKVRYYGIFSPSCRPQLGRARKFLSDQLGAPQLTPNPSPATDRIPRSSPPARSCPLCRVGMLVLSQTLSPQRSRSP